MKRALVIDDSQAMRQIVARAVRMAGVNEIDEADNVEAALLLFEPAKYHVVVTDWHMEGASGLELVRAIRKQDRKIPIVMVTVNTQRTDVIQAIEAGVSDFLGKPFKEEMLCKKIKKHVG